jgi:hypothetical protein
MPHQIWILEDVFGLLFIKSKQLNQLVFITSFIIQVLFIYKISEN